MKTRFLNIIALVATACAFVACADDNDEARTPLAQVTVSQTELEINQTMELVFTGVADQMVVYTGDKDHQYELRDSSNTGFAVSKGQFRYSYTSPGVFHVVCVAATYDTYLGASLHTDTVGFYVNVTDPVNTIDAIYSTVTPNVYYAELTDDATWLMCLPTKQLYNNREMAVNASRMRLSFDVASDSAKIYIDDELYNARTYYNLTQPHAIRCVAGSGQERNYMFYAMVYPEFTTISVGGQTAKLVRNAYYQDLLTYTYSATDDATLSFTLPADVQLLANGQPVATDSQLNPGATYTLRRTHADNERLQAVSRVVFTTN